MGFPLPMPNSGGGCNSRNQEIMPVIPPGLTAGREKLQCVIHNCSPTFPPHSGDESFLPLSGRCTELSISSTSSALDIVTEDLDGPLGSCELLVSDITKNTKITNLTLPRVCYIVR